MLKEFKEKTMGFPIVLTEEKWNEILDRMIFLLTEMNEDTCSMQNESVKILGVVKPTISAYDATQNINIENEEKYAQKKYIEIAEYRNKCKDEFYDLMKKYHWDLWW